MTNEQNHIEWFSYLSIPSRYLKVCVNPLFKKKSHGKGWPTHRIVWNVGKSPDCRYFCRFTLKVIARREYPKQKWSGYPKNGDTRKNCDRANFGILGIDFYSMTVRQSVFKVSPKVICWCAPVALIHASSSLIFCFKSILWILTLSARYKSFQV